MPPGPAWAGQEPAASLAAGNAACSAGHRRHSFPGYHLIRLTAVHYAQAQRAADWEFTYDNGSQLIHVLDRNILAGAHHAYALYWSTPASEWQDSFHFFRAFASTFRPAGMAQGS